MAYHAEAQENYSGRHNHMLLMSRQTANNDEPAVMEVRESFFNEPLHQTSISFHSRIKVSPEARSLVVQDIPSMAIQQQLQVLEQ